MEKKASESNYSSHKDIEAIHPGTTGCPFSIRCTAGPELGVRATSLAFMGIGFNTSLEKALEVWSALLCVSWYEWKEEFSSQLILYLHLSELLAILIFVRILVAVCQKVYLCQLSVSIFSVSVFSISVSVSSCIPVATLSISVIPCIYVYIYIYIIYVSYLMHIFIYIIYINVSAETESAV